MKKILKAWKKRICKNDGMTVGRLSRRVSSEKGLAFLEFALISPVILALTVFLIEIVFLWDNTIMANHSTFALARIAKVHVKNDQVEYPTFFGKSSDKAITGLFMMTSTRGWYLGLPHKMFEFPDFSIDNMISDLFPKNFPGNMLNPVNPGGGGQNGFPGMNISFDKILKKALAKLKEKINTLFFSKIQKMLQKYLPKSNGSYVIRYSMAMQRLYMYDCLKTELIALKDNGGGEVVKTETDDKAPTLAHPSSKKEGMYKNPKIVKVSLDYPMYKRWLFTYFLGPKGSAQEARGRCVMLVEPEKMNVKSYFVKQQQEN